MRIPTTKFLARVAKLKIPCVRVGTEWRAGHSGVVERRDHR